MKQEPITGLAKHLCYNVVTYGKPGLYGTKGQMEILQSSSSDEGAFFPAQSIAINTLDGVKKLRDFCEELILAVESNEQLNNQSKLQ